MEGVERKRPHIVLLPLMAQGHIIPFFELAKLLARRGGFLITIVNTPRNLVRLQPMVSSACKVHEIEIRLQELPFPRGIEGVPSDVENTDALPYNLMFVLVRSTEQLEKPFEQLLRRLCEDEDSRPTCVISDMFFGWSLEVCNRVGIPRVTFLTMGAFATCVYNSLWMHLPHKNTESDTFSLAPDLPHVSFHRSQLPLSLKQTDETDPWYLFLKRQIPCNLRSWGTLLNTFDELERKFVDHMRENVSGGVWSVGPVLREVFDINHGSNHGACLQWLDSHLPRSVLYISFGTQVRITYRQTQELALGLEASRIPFIWAVRPPVEITDGFTDFLPEGFEERMEESKQGLLIRGWAPQVMILSHGSTGGFLSHCGWNSVLESLSHGVPIISWPIAAEQFYNSKLLEEDGGVSVEICRGIDGEVDKAKVERTVKMIMEGEKGRELRKKAMDMRDATRKAFSNLRDEGRDTNINININGSSLANIDGFIKEVNLLALSSKSF
ncbi:hypothetical protein SUGI_0038550 [Cryptomeria japonica]|uniref:UDP-glycosyltransferase 92A1 n=1 Tax=Cryptomeria japonica TaxID=3369 RepID=UPI002408B37A|nr:UDP-glycosyltransferase 92A1 [Cryptomeria japonica]GLJ06416.1 hypothetical protein SUGI_0038550 [Cryptomeria japonica]